MTTFTGTMGNDTFYINDSADIIVEPVGGGTDTAISSVSYTLGANVENLTLTGTANLNGTGNTLANLLTGNTGNNLLDGGPGADTMVGGAGNDTYLVDNVGDVVTELAGEGIDTVKSSISYTLGANLENLVLTGTANLSGTGNTLANILTGNTGNNVLDGGAGADTLVGGAGNDTYVVDNLGDVVTELAGEGIDTVKSSVNFTLGANLENLTATGTDSIASSGNELNNILTGNTGNDTLRGGAGADTMIGGLGNDTYIVDDALEVITERAEEGSDTVISYINYTLGANLENLSLYGPAAGINATGNALNNNLVGNAGNNILDGGRGNDALNGSTGTDTMIGGAGDDSFVVEDMGDVVTELAGEGTDSVNSYISYTLGDNVENLTLNGTDAINGTGNALNNGLTGNAANNILDGGLGADTLNGSLGDDSMIGGAGDDLYYVESVGDVITELAGEGIDTVNSSISYTLSANIEKLTLTGATDITATGNDQDNLLTGNAGNNILGGGIGNDTLNGSTGADTMIGGAGDDVYTVERAGDVVTELAGEGTDQVNSYISYTLGDNLENLTLLGTFTIDGTGNALNNSIKGNESNNILDGGLGADTLYGGLGDDTYVVDDIDDQVSEWAGGGTDTVLSSRSYVLNDQLENLTLTGTANINGNGSYLANILVGNTGNNQLDGQGGADTLRGGAGDDIYIVDNVGDVVTELAGEGIDLVKSAISYTLGANVEKLTLSDATDINATGNALANTLTGNTGNNILDGGAGADTLSGGAGNDTYLIDEVGDVIIESPNAGTDTALSSSSFTLGANLENLTLTGTAAIDGTGNTLANTLTGNIGNNVLDGGAGADTLVGGAGHDTYVVDNLGDVVTELAGEGTDTVNSALSYTLGDNVENLTLTGTAALNGTGNTLNNTLTGNAGNNLLDGGAGVDTLIGGAGDDTYAVDRAGDVITELAGGGTDTVLSASSYTLGDNVENLTFTGTANLNGTGSAQANTLTGNAGNNVLDGGLGADTLIGGLGDDTYVIDNASDLITELDGEGIDTARSAISYTLAANVEHLILTGTDAINATGSALDNTLTGNAGNNVLDGGAGADTLIGGAGDDTYVVDNLGDVVTELAAGGTDTVKSAISYTLGANLEHLTLTGTAAVDGTGNALANTLTGNAGNNVLNGGAGADTLIGGAGDDTYVVDNLGDVVTELASGGTDTVKSGIAYTLGANLEKLILTGTASINGTGNDIANTLTGNAGNNVLDGGLGADTVIGGNGDDTYVVENVGDVITELDGEGIDTAISSSSYTLGANIENLTLTGTTAQNGTGNALNNVLTGNAIKNILDGGVGADTLIGGAGDDTYIVDSVGDVITELAGGGTDTALSYSSYTLGANVENLTLTGTAAIDGTGNAQANTLTGNAGNNILDGGLASDTLVGGLGNDTYVIDIISDVILELAGEGTDTAIAPVSYTLGANVENLVLTGAGNSNGTGNATANTLMGNAGNNLLDGGLGADTMIGGMGNDTYIIENVGDAITELDGAGTDTALTAISYTLAANVENLILAGTTDINGTGNTLANTLTGNAGNNILDGGTGADTLVGGKGNDTYVIDNPSDTIVEGISSGMDLARSSVSYTLAANVENLTLTGTANINATGNALANTLMGNAGSNVLDGAVGADTLMGGAGDDTYVIEGVGDSVIELAGEGTDTVNSALSYTLGDNVENLTLTGKASINGYGNALNNVLTGNATNNRLDGGVGADTLIGGLGDDTYIIDNAGDVITELTAGGPTPRSVPSPIPSATTSRISR